MQTFPQNTQENTIAKYMDLGVKIDQMTDLYVNKMDRIIDEIHNLSDTRYIKILHDHYVPDKNHRVKSLEQIAVEMNYSHHHVCRLHGEALLAFARINMRPNATSDVLL